MDSKSRAVMGMTAKEYLMGILYLDRQIESKLELSQRLRAKAERMTGALSLSKGDGRVMTDTTAIIDRLIDLEREINGMVDEYVDRKRAAIAAIGQMDDPRQALLLEMRYLQGCGWPQIAQALGYEEAQTYRLHVAALKKFKIPET